MVAYEGNEPYVFISYAHKDKELVLPIIRGLQDRGFRVWYDQGIEVGNEWPDFIAEHIESCCGMVAFVSRNFGESNNCREKLGFAKELEKTILVIYLEDRKKLRAGVRMRLSTLHYMNLDDYADRGLFLDELAKAKALRPCLDADVPAIVSVAAAPAQVTVPAKPAGSGMEELHKQGRACLDKKEYEKAFSLIKKAAEQGYAPAQNDVGCCYEFGRGVSNSLEDAVRWYCKAAEQGYARAQCNLADCYESGRGISRNYADAVKWYRKAAEQGYTRAQYNLGLCYQYGKSVQKNKGEAKKWYQMAADQGDKNAVEKLKILK